MNKNFWKRVIDFAVIVLTALSSYLGASAQVNGYF